MGIFDSDVDDTPEVRWLRDMGHLLGGAVTLFGGPVVWLAIAAVVAALQMIQYARDRRLVVAVDGLVDGGLWLLGGALASVAAEGPEQGIVALLVGGAVLLLMRRLRG